MKRIILIALLLMMTGVCLAQLDPRRYKTLADVEKEAEEYFDKYYGTMPDSIFFHEGGAYNGYQRFLNEWRPLVGQGSIEKYIMHCGPKNRGGGPPPTPCSETTWHELGPYGRPEGIIPSNGGMEAGIGPVEFILIHPTTPNHMLCGAVNGGLFHSSDSGVTWQNAGGDTQWDFIGCVAAAFHPSNTATWYAVSLGHFPAFTERGGFYRTTNSGATWTKVGGASIFGSWSNVHCMVVDPFNANNCLVGTSNGMLRTTNLNSPVVTWTPWTSRIFPNSRIFDLALRPGYPSEVYATVADGTFSNNGNDYGTDWRIMKSTDFGATWSVVAIPATFNAGINLTMEFNSLDGDNMYVINGKDIPGCQVVYSGPCNDDHELYRYHIPSGIWYPIDNDLSIIYGGGHGFGVASNTTTEVIYTAHGDRYRVYQNGISTLYSDSDPNIFEYHVDVEDFVAHPSNPDEVWMASHGGVYKSIDKGDTWANMSQGLGVAEVEGMACSYTNPEYVLLGLNHDASVLTQTAYSSGWLPTWHVRGNYDGQQPLIDNVNANNMFVSAQNQKWWRSTNAGASFSNLPFTSGSFRTNGVLNQVDPTIFYRPVQSQNAVYRSFNQGTTYEVASSIGSLYAAFNSGVQEVYTQEKHRDYIYAQVALKDPNTNQPAGHGLCRSDDINNPVLATAVNSWETLPLPSGILHSCSGNTNFEFSDVFIDYDDPDIVYLTANSSAGCTSDLIGAHMVWKLDYNMPGSPVFTDLTYDLPNTATGPIVREKGTDGGMYVVTGEGVYYTDNKRISLGVEPIWCEYGENLPHGRAVELEINYVVNKIRIGFYGRGSWEADLYCPSTTDMAFPVGNHPATLFQEVTNNITSAATVVTGADVTYRAGNQIRLLPGFKTQSNANFHAFIHPCDHSGNSFKQYVADEIIMREEEGEVKQSIEGFRVFPNPANHTLSIVLEASDDPIREVLILDMSGRLVRTVSVANQSSQFEMDVADLTKGLYLLEIVTETRWLKSRFVKSE